MDAISNRWRDREPWVVTEPIHNREWLCPEPLKYYLYHDKEGNWRVVNRQTDLPVGIGHKSRNAAIRAFYKLMDRPIPTGTAIEECPGAQYKS